MICSKQVDKAIERSLARAKRSMQRTKNAMFKATLLAEKIQISEKIKEKEIKIRKMRLSVFDVEDKALAHSGGQWEPTGFYYLDELMNGCAG